MESNRNYSEYELCLEATSQERIIDLTAFDATAKNFFTESKSFGSYDLGMVASKYTKMIDEAFANLVHVSTDSAKISDFLSQIKNYPSFDERPLTMPMKNTAEVEKIKTMYLVQFATDAVKTIDDIIKGKIKQVDLLPFFSDANAIRLKKQIVRTALNPVVTLKDYAKTNPSILCEVDRNFIITICLPFLREFDTQKKVIQDELNTFRNDIVSCRTRVDEYVKTLESMRADGKIPVDRMETLNFFLYNFVRLVEQLITYTSFMELRKINNYAFNVRSLNELYQKIMNYYPNGAAVLHESVLDGTTKDIDEAGMVNDMLQGRPSILMTVADSLYRKVATDYAQMRTADDTNAHSENIMNSIMGSRNGTPKIYEDIENMFVSVTKSMGIIMDNLKDPNIIFDDMIEKAMLKDSLSSRFQMLLAKIPYADLPEGDDMDPENMKDIFNPLLAELQASDKNLLQIASAIRDCYAAIKKSKSDIEMNMDSVFKNPSLNRETLEFLDTIELQLRDLVLMTGTHFVTRFKQIDDICENLLKPVEIDVFTPSPEMDHKEERIDFVEMAYESIFESEECVTEMIFESKVADFNYNKMLKNMGLYSEADAPAAPATPTTPAKPETPAKPDAVQVEEDPNKQSDAAKAQNAEAAAQKTDANGEKKFDIKKFFQNFLKTVTSFFDTISSKFKTAMDKILPGNKKFLETSKNSLLNRSYDGLKLKIAPYSNLKKNIYDTDIQKLTMQINSLSAETIIKGDKAEIQSHLLGFIPNIASATTLSKAIQNYYKCGKLIETDIEAIEYRNAQLKVQVTTMIEFSEEYYNGGYLKMSNALGAVKKALTSKMNAIKGELESSTNATSGANAASSIVRTYCGAMLNAYRDRNNDYFKAMRALVPTKGKNVPNQETPAENTGETQPVENQTEQTPTTPAPVEPAPAT